MNPAVPAIKIIITFSLILLVACSENDPENRGNDNINNPPVASNLIITDNNGGNANVGDSLSGSYTYSDTDGDQESNVRFRWLRNGAAIDGEFSQNYTLTAMDSGTTLSFEVIPHSTTGTSPGVAATVLFNFNIDNTSWDPTHFSHVYDVGPGQDYATPSEVPWESLEASTLVRIHWRDEPYRHKWVINTVATAENPLVIVGIPNGNKLPVISGAEATTRQALNYWNEDRSVIKIGGSNLPNDSVMPAHIIIQSLEIIGAHPNNSFTDDTGNDQNYRSNAASIHLEKGAYITIHDCILHDSGNGLFSGSSTSDVLISGNSIYGNGIEGSIYHHNSYTESLGITFEYNHYGSLKKGALGNNLKDRSAGTIIRYNWVESGNRQLDLVDTNHFQTESSYRTTWVYGNILVEPEGAGNAQILHYGGDSGSTERYRKGTLHFYHNTVISTRTSNTTLILLSTAEENADIRNNLIMPTAGGNHLAIIDGDGNATLSNNWLPLGWKANHGSAKGSVTDNGNTVETDPGLIDINGQDFRLTFDSTAVGAAGELSANALSLTHQYRLHQKSVSRPIEGDADIGAFERSGGVEIGNSAPIASNVIITEANSDNAETLGNLRGNYRYSDVDSDTEGGTTFRWLRNGIVIANANSQNYPLTASDNASLINFEVTPRATRGEAEGEVIISSPLIILTTRENSVPVANNVRIIGNHDSGFLIGAYTYNDADGDSEGSTSFRWLRNGSAIPDANTLTYTLSDIDEGASITFEVTPQASRGEISGEAVISSAIKIPRIGNNQAPFASNVKIIENDDGNMLAGIYTYDDIEGDAEANTTFRWLRNGSAITGATSQWYSLLAIDFGSAITFEITPIATDGKTIGAAVKSAPFVVNNHNQERLDYRVEIQNTAASVQYNIPVTFGQVFLEGDIPAGHTFQGHIVETGEDITLQTDKKATHADGSLRHAIFSTILPSVAANGSITLETIPIRGYIDNSETPLSDLLNTQFDTRLELQLNAESGAGHYAISVKELLETANTETWISGPVVTEWMVSAPLIDTTTGSGHEHLTARFNIRYYNETGDIKIDTVIENNWTYAPNPRNFTYDVQILVNSDLAYDKKMLEHFSHARWRQTVWSHGQPSIHIKHDPTQLMQSKAVPNYDPALIYNIDADTLASLELMWETEPNSRCMIGDDRADCNSNKPNLRRYSLPRKGPMGHGLMQALMPTTGERPDIGPLPSWTANYVLNQDRLSKAITLIHGNQAGSFPVHYRNKTTGRIINLQEQPYFTSMIAGATIDPETEKFDLPAACQTSNQRDCQSPFLPDTAHTPSLSYIPYLVTGDHYYMEELIFWVNWAVASKTNTAHREWDKGVFSQIFQDSGQAWQMRELARAAAFIPDDSFYKNNLTRVLENNIQHYLSKYVEGQPNQYGAMISNYSYPSSSPWMDDFFTWSVSHIADLGFVQIKPLAKWKAKFPVQRMGLGIENNNYCWIFGSAYHLKIAADPDSPMYQTINEVHEATQRQQFLYDGEFNHHGLECASTEQADTLELEQNEMIGNAHSTTGLPSNMQAALAAAVNQQKTEGANDAWTTFESRNNRPDYSTDPTWAIVPRGATKQDVTNYP